MSPTGTTPTTAIATADRAPKRPLPDTYWVTRARDKGQLANTFEVWSARPDRLEFPDGDVSWFAPLNSDDDVDAYLGTWTMGQAVLELRAGIPDTDREVIIVGAEPPPAPFVPVTKVTPEKVN